MSAINDSCVQHDTIEQDGVRFTVGDKITFDTVDWGAKTEESRKVRTTGTITELWVEAWRDTHLMYAEVVSGSGERRAWFHRDDVTHATGIEGAIGSAPEGAMF